ncbi:hypothetical protein TB1_012792 [Malus domestica]
MGPVRGVRKRKKAEKNDSPADGYCEENASIYGSSEKEGLVDWWDEASRRINVLHLTTVWANVQMAKLLNPTSFKAISHFIANRSKIVKKKKKNKLRIIAAIFEWFTKRTIKSVIFSKRETKGLGRNMVFTQHLLLGLTVEEEQHRHLHLNSHGFLSLSIYINQAREAVRTIWHHHSQS